MLEEIAKKASSYANRKILPRHVERVIYALSITDDPRELVDLSDIPLVYVADILRALKEEGLIEFSDGIKLTESGEDLAEEIEAFPIDLSCPVCSGRGVLVPQERLEAYEEIVKGRPEPIHERDQGYVTPTTAIARVAFMVSHGDVQGKEILIIGDDDLMSIALSVTELPRAITVLEADKRIIEFIKKRSKEYGFDIEAIEYDIRNPLPEDREERFDTFNTDPTETIEAIKAFVGRGIRSLKLGGAGYFGVTRVESSLYKRKKHQEILLSLGAVITDLMHDFNHYVNRPYYEETRGREALPIKRPPRSIRYKSSLYRIEKIERGGFNEPIEISKDFYYDDEVATV